MSLLDILACPLCKVGVSQRKNQLECERCGTFYPIIDGVPIMFPNGVVPDIVHEADLQVRETYHPWVHRVILQSLLDDQIVLDIGAGNMALDDPCIIRMDVLLSPYVDLVADVHYLPFLPESIDYILSLAVVEHLRNPFQAADSIYDALKDGGYIYHECNFVFAYHGYPHHYFNASMQGMEQVFSRFVPLRKGVAPYQMPSFAIQMVLGSYLSHSKADQFKHGRELAALIRRITAQNLMEFDIYFEEEAALNVAAGTYFSGIKQRVPGASLIPPIFHELWEAQPELQARYPDINRLTTADNILIWARQDGRERFPEVAAYLDGIRLFNKRGEETGWQRSEIRAMPVIEPRYGAIGFDPAVPMEEHAGALRTSLRRGWRKRLPRWYELVRFGANVLREEGLRSFLVKLGRYVRAR